MILLSGKVRHGDHHGILVRVGDKIGALGIVQIVLRPAAVRQRAVEGGDDHTIVTIGWIIGLPRVQIEDG